MRKFFTLRILIVAIFAVGVAPSALAGEAADTIDDFQKAYIDVALLWRDLDKGEQRKQMAPLINRYFASETMLRYVMGGKGRGFTRSQRQRLEEGFALFLRDRIGARLHLGDVMEARIVDEESTKNRTWRISAQMNVKGGTPVAFDYILARHANRWRIVNLFRGGVSELALWRTEFARVLEDRGIDELSRRLSGVTTAAKNAK